MAIANVGVQLPVSSEAIGRLDCFVANFDSVVYELAEEIAKTRAAGRPADHLRIEVEDVEEAAASVLRELRKGVAEGRVPSELTSVIDSMEECLESRRAKKP